jgi:hypothetical protein
MPKTELDSRTLLQLSEDDYLNPPWCNRCQKLVDEWSYETSIAEKPRGLFGEYPYLREFVNTGEIIITVKCHGEVWKASNWRGWLK